MLGVNKFNSPLGGKSRLEVWAGRKKTSPVAFKYCVLLVQAGPRVTISIRVICILRRHWPARPW